MSEFNTEIPEYKDKRSKAVKKLRLLVYTQKVNVESFRKKLNEAFCLPVLPNRIDCESKRLENSNEVGYDILSPVAFVKNRFIFYIHGGSFVGGSPAAWHNFCSSFANECNARLVLPDFRLAPQHAFPASLEDIQKVFDEIYRSRQRPAPGNSAPDELEFVIAADGSGASLALALIQNMKERTRECLKGLVLFSPWLNVSKNALVFSQRRSGDEVLQAENIRTASDLYTYTSNLTHPLVSPVYASPEKIRALPPVYIQMGESEILVPDAKKFASILEENNIQCTLDLCPGMMHLFQMAEEYLKTSQKATERVCNYIKKSLFDKKSG